MSRNVSFHKLAEVELNATSAYYHTVRPALAEAFLEEIGHCIQSIAHNPEAGMVLVGSIRRRLARRFPYAVVYSLRSEDIRVLAIMHLRRRPGYWLGRT